MPVDGILLSSINLVVDESDMTGESEPVYKSLEADHYNPLLISGSKVLEGVGYK
jgi:magnesium-transporting ATPase (P-type)